jgi:membrane protein
MSIQAIFFDLDGTLVDSNDLHVRAWDEAFRKGGHTFDSQVIHDQIGKGSDMLVPSLLPHLDAESVRALGDDCGEIFKTRYLDQVRAFPGAHALLARVHAAGQRVVLASSASGAEVEHYIDLLDARDLVSARTSADDVEHTKPAPDIFAAALRKVAPIGPKEVMVVGDTPYDVEAARACGIPTIALRSGKFTDAALHQAGAVAIYDDVAALLAGYDRSPLAGGVPA